MADFVGWVGQILALPIVHLGAVAPGGVDITPGLLLAASMIFGFAISVFKRLKGRG